MNNKEGEYQSLVSITHGQNRYSNIYQSLNNLKKEIQKKIENKKRIVIKPNLCVRYRSLAVTHIEGIKALLDFLKTLTIEKIIIAEAPFDGSGYKNFKKYDYFKELKGYNIEFIDLNQDKTKEIEISNSALGLLPLKLNVAQTIIESDFVISLCPPKTHDTVIVTLALKNLLVGSIIVKKRIIGNHPRSIIHQGYKNINIILSELAKIIPPHLSVIDGLVGMQANGPVFGKPITMNLSLCGFDFLAVDAVTAYLMGFDPFKIGYLYYCHQEKLGCADLKKIKTIGIDNLDQYRLSFKPHKTYKQQQQWQI